MHLCTCVGNLVHMFEIWTILSYTTVSHIRQICFYTVRKLPFIYICRKLEVCGLKVHSDLETRLGFMLNFNQISYFKFHVSKYTVNFIKFQISNFRTKLLEASTKFHLLLPLGMLANMISNSISMDTAFHCK